MTVSSRDYKAERIRGKDKKKGKKVVWSYAFSHRHERYRQTGFKTKAEAEAAETKKRHEVICQGRVTHKKKFGYLADIADGFIKHRYVVAARNTVDHEKPILKPVLSFFDRKRIDHITKADIQDYVGLRSRRGLCNRTINIELTFLRKFLDYAKDRGYSEYNAGRLVKTLKQAKYKKYRLPDEERFQQFVEESRSTKYGEIFNVYVLFRIKTGLRPGEATGFMWSDIDFKNDKVYVVSREDNPLKKDAERAVDLHPSLKEMLLTWRESWRSRMGSQPPHDYVFYNPQNPTERAKGFRGAFRTARMKAGLPKLRSYDLRHIFISTAIMSGVDYLTIMNWSGHKSSEMIDEVYGHLRPKHTKSKMQEMNFGIGQ